MEAAVLAAAEVAVFSRVRFIKLELCYENLLA